MGTGSESSETCLCYGTTAEDWASHHLSYVEVSNWKFRVLCSISNSDDCWGSCFVESRNFAQKYCANRKHEPSSTCCGCCRCGISTLWLQGPRFQTSNPTIFKFLEFRLSYPPSPCSLQGLGLHNLTKKPWVWGIVGFLYVLHWV